jgi:hypothetical protein
MNRLDWQMKIINEMTKDLKVFFDKEVEIRANELFDKLMSTYEKDKQLLKKDIQPNKWEEVRGEKVFKRLKEMGLNHKDMIKFKEAKLSYEIIAKILNLGEKTVSGYYKNYAEGKK